MRCELRKVWAAHDVPERETNKTTEDGTMAVITTTGVDDEYGNCNLCGGGLRPPFLSWHGAKLVCFCTSCCIRHGKGLNADFVQVCAIAELHAAGHRDVTLTREQIATVAERCRRMMTLAAPHQPPRMLTCDGPPRRGMLTLGAPHRAHFVEAAEGED